jgi:poly(3-hydroxybutyrate) depolymerase
MRLWQRDRSFLTIFRFVFGTRFTGGHGIMESTAGPLFSPVAWTILLILLVYPSHLVAQSSMNSLSAGCGSTNAPAGLLTMSTKDGDGTARKYLMQVPTNYDSHTAYSLVLVFHGWGGTAEGTRASGLQNAPGAASGAIFVFPQGIQFGKVGVGWDDSAQGRDLALFDNLVSAVEASYCIAKDEIFAAGFSWGGDFSTALACERGDAIRAVAVNSATDEFKDNSDYTTFADFPCPGRRHPDVRFEHAVDADPAYAAPNFATTSKLFQALNHCSADSKAIDSSTPQISCRRFEHCSSTYIECPFDKSIGHTLPPNWPEDTWAFFAALRRTDRNVGHYGPSTNLKRP